MAPQPGPSASAESPRSRRTFNYRRILSVWVLAGSLGGLFFGGSVFLALDLLSTRHAMIERLGFVAKDLAEACAQTGPRSREFSDLARGVPWEDIEFVQVQNHDGGVVATLGPDGDAGFGFQSGGFLDFGVWHEFQDPDGPSGTVLVQGSTYPLILRAVNGLGVLLGLIALAAPVAYAASRRIYGKFSGQVLDLVHVANAISSRRDFSIRAVRRGEEEIGILVDTFNHMITQIELSEGQLRSEVERAEAAKLAKSQFLATMSHEIRTPINGILGMIQLLLDTELSQEQEEFSRTILGSTEGLLAIINDILDFSKVEAGRLELEEISFSVSEVLKGCLEPASILANEKGLELCCEIERDVPDALHGDPARVRQILLNLTNNALKFTSEGEVVVRVALEDDDSESPTLRFEVRDSGIGVPADRMDRLFRPFSQVEAAHNRTYGGTGLGLAICQKIVEAMGGEMFVRSKEGVGSVFGFVVQFRRDFVMALERPRGPSGVRVLIGDGNRTSLGILARSLDDANSVHAVSDLEGLARALAESDSGAGYDLCLLDVGLARELAETGASRPAAPLVVLAPVARMSEARSLARGRRSSVVSKPVRRDDLLWCISELLIAEERPDPALPGKDAAQEEEAPDTLSHLDVLVAEDNAVNQRIITRFLEKLDVSWLLVENGKEAFHAVEQRKFDVVLMDVQMPVMDGLQATRAIREFEAGRSDHTPIVAMTANAMEEDRRNCEEAGFDFHLPKPLRFEQLREFLIARFGRKRARRGAEEPFEQAGDGRHLYPSGEHLGVERRRPPNPPE
ncbi:MAG: ATP-binding protein [Planctomycetota bacterium]